MEFEEELFVTWPNLDCKLLDFSPLLLLVFFPPHLLLIMLIITPFTTDFCQVGDCCVVSVNLFQIQLIQHIIGNF